MNDYHLGRQEKRANFKKHYPLSLIAPNEHSDGDRMEYLGYSIENRLVYLVTVEKDEEVIRIVSARKATTYEREKYEEGI